MKAGGYVVMAVMAIICALLVFGTRWLEVQHYRKHPPDDDGCRVEKFDEEGEK